MTCSVPFAIFICYFLQTFPWAYETVELGSSDETYVDTDDAASGMFSEIRFLCVCSMSAMTYIIVNNR